MKKIILTDVDGVCLDWEYAFDVYLQQHGFSKKEGGNLKYDIGERYGIDKEQGRRLIKIFNESAHIGFLPPLRDAMYYMKRLHEEHGYVFHAITSLSRDENAQKLREMNLSKLFGSTAFERVICLDTGAPKHQALTQYRDSGLVWVEDKPENALAGHQLGLSSILMEHGHNMHYHHPDITVVKNWRQIYDLLVTPQL
jgi:FMN phosphatase YigB (HAD superfamily)